jgi:hypothetical protein
LQVIQNDHHAFTAADNVSDSSIADSPVQRVNAWRQQNRSTRAGRAHSAADAATNRWQYTSTHRFDFGQFWHAVIVEAVGSSDKAMSETGFSGFHSIFRPNAPTG